MDRELEKRLSEAESKIETAKSLQVKILSQIGIGLINSGRITTMEIDAEQNVHMFLRSASNPDKVIHIQGYPGFSDTDNLAMEMREMDYQKLVEIRAKARELGDPSIGNEHLAVTRMVTEELTVGPVSLFVDLLKTEFPLPVLEGTATQVIRPSLLK